MIGDDIEITLVDIRGDKVRLGINAPTRIAVHRKEVYEAIRTENQRAAKLAGTPLPAVRTGARPAPARASTVAGTIGPPPNADATTRYSSEDPARVTRTA